MALGFFIITTVIFSITTTVYGILLKDKSSTGNKFAVENGTIGFPPILPDDGDYIQWTILHLNDVYELLPLDEGRKGGLARVAHVRELLLKENSQTYTILAGDFLSPSALSQAIVDGTILNGKQMIQAFNTLGLDFVTFGNHEFDLKENDLVQRMNESTYTWISSNVFHSQTNQSLFTSIPYKILTIQQIQVLLIGLTIDFPSKYVNIINQTSLVPFLQSLSHIK
jgi:5'-nucleotidase